jgi:hypothetical protein
MLFVSDTLPSWLKDCRSKSRMLWGAPVKGYQPHIEYHFVQNKSLVMNE